MTGPVSIAARTVLFGHAAREVVESELAERLHDSGVDELVLRHAPAVTVALRSATLRELARAVDELLAIDLGGVVVMGWRRYEKLHGAALRTRAGGTEQVELLEHEVVRSACPRLDVTIDEHRVCEFEVDVEAAVLLRPLTATVRDGMLVALGPGDCTVTISLGVPQLGPIFQREQAFPVGIMVDLRRPIPLAPHPAPAPDPTEPQPNR
ncbi:hypothetical protein [Nocardia blacklockiae]|uniref:hypothetical protein n=1 Tax=Nocardia blacklockiae TaxID=480036 RepID=UPI0018949FC6|nr:hypothetical protein [Nocardia blacklockiae]MBF6170984.1 hypothetical protein [Nocardia blacklockiae]